ncbi:protein-glutamate O-methyltransferase CheR [Methanosarcina sp. KYL-1]|uniref:CheR family methyltransferase n=1 Tax=Methanosarcina sp. KYL-1 TaxID=2602068 RepID=UPI0021019074|nr:protein-glutamate O-methyltransferase CheR [Methanosarcina sp. KYL-1]MCQ1535955.1 protein-glutamate O-methyltransferase CheR [Methanosarcina sp. KYL-1]
MNTGPDGKRNIAEKGNSTGKSSVEDLFEEDPGFEVLKQVITKNTGFNCNQYKESHFRRRINVRVRATNSGSYAEYLKVLKKDPEEYRHLIEALTVNVSEFFRNPETYRIIEEEILPSVIKSKSEAMIKSIRIWSAGCASGEEAYSFAILLHEILNKDFDKYRISIIGTDIDTLSLEKARKGIYNESVMKNVDTSTRELYFTKKGEKYQISEQLKKIAHFKQHDLISGSGMSHFDIIICRNVMIYFKKEIQEHLHINFYRALNTGGYFIIGKAETLLGTANNLFKPYNTRERLYIKGTSGDIHGTGNKESK